MRVIKDGSLSKISFVCFFGHYTAAISVEYHEVHGIRHPTYGPQQDVHVTALHLELSSLAVVGEELRMLLPVVRDCPSCRPTNF